MLRYNIDRFIAKLEVAKELNRHERRIIRMERKIDPVSNLKIVTATALVVLVTFSLAVYVMHLATETEYQEYRKVYNFETQQLEEE